MVRVTCDACFKGYYTGKKRLAISPESGRDFNCQEKHILDQNGYQAGRNRFCYTRAKGTCIECPHGANCTAGVISLPNYWGHITATDSLEFHRCPVGYCCNQAPCQGIDQCAANRKGRLCGRCMKGFTESLITPECIPDQTCSDWWIVPLFCLWTLTVALVIVFSPDILQIRETFWKCIKRNKSSEQTQGEVIEIPSEIELNNKDDIEMQSTSDSNSSSEHSEVVLETMPSIGTQTLDVKFAILYGTLHIQREEHVEAPGSHKYLQIMLYYLQDAALMQVDLALDSSIITPIQKVRQLLLNVSQLAVDLLDLGLNLCPFPGWTPVTKLLTKNLTGPFVFCHIIAMYVIVRMLCWCFPHRGKSLKAYWYTRLTAATLFSILLFYQQIANVAFSLQHCIISGGKSVLFIDGTVTCSLSWQIFVVIFYINWVLGIIQILLFLPGLLELRLIRVSHFFLACVMPFPMLLFWVIKFYRKQLQVLIPKDNIPPWHEEALRILQKTFVKTTDNICNREHPLCWVGIMKTRRLFLVIIFVFISNLVARISLMCLIILFFLVFHLQTQPYQDELANKLYTVSLVATLTIGFINIMKAACVEFYLDLDKVGHFLTTLNMITDSILVYCPIGFVGLTIAAIAMRKVRQILQRIQRKEKSKV